MTETFYDVLGVGTGATQEEITDAYREKVKQYHPDVSDHPDAPEKFRKVVQAEEVLGDEREREKYDDMTHSTYVRRVETDNAAGTEQSPWTTTDRRNDSHDTGFGGVGKDPSGNGNAGGSRRRTTGASVGFGKAAGRQASANWTGRETGSRWSSASYASGGTNEGSSYSVHDWAESQSERKSLGFRVTQEEAIVGFVMFLLYPVFVWASVNPGFPAVINLTVGVCTLLAVAYFLTIPRLGMAIFGAWSLLSPVAVLLFTDQGLAVEVLAVGACWLPFGYSLVVASLVEPGVQPR
jgi:curved DNA-binding protein CbpA